MSTVRVRPSSIQLLPAKADRAVAQALHDVIVRSSATQSVALATLNAALADLGIEPVKMSSFNRLVQQFRNDGIPSRYRLTGQPGVPANDPLLDLIDHRIGVALQRLGVR